MPDELTKRIQETPNPYRNFAEAGNGRIVAIHDQHGKFCARNENDLVIRNGNETVSR